MTTVMFITEPLLPMIINLILKTNISAPHEFPVPMEWIVIDKEKYYWLLFSNSSVCIMVILTVLISYDVIFITFIHHAYGLFAITGYQFFPNLFEFDSSWFKLNFFLFFCRYRIRNMPNDVVRKNNLTSGVNASSNSDDVHYKHLVSCIRIHKRALEYVKKIYDSNNAFTIIIINMLPKIC